MSRRKSWKETQLHSIKLTSEAEGEPSGWHAAHQVTSLKEGEVTFLGLRSEGTSFSIEVTFCVDQNSV